jgi:naphthalene 1,2-dioxygenase system ferredoxin subunit
MIYSVADAADVPPGTMLHVELDGRMIALYNYDGEFYATDDICTHRRARLSDGYLDGRTVQCPLHFGKFDIVTGEPLNPPCKIRLATYPVTLDIERLLVDVPEPEAPAKTEPERPPLKRTDYALSKLFFDLQKADAAAEYRADRAAVLDRYGLDAQIRAALLADDVATLAPLVNPYLLRYYCTAAGMPEAEFLEKIRG